jgi:hypothetical protein
VKESTRQAPSSATNGNGDTMIPSPLSSPRPNLARESPRFNTIPDSPRDSPGLTMNQVKELFYKFILPVFTADCIVCTV